jgi:hypothetical protein
MAIRRLPIAITFLTLAFSFSRAQDAQSLGDVARQTRQQKQQKQSQAQNASPQDSDPENAKPLRPTHVVTNDEIPEHVEPDTPPGSQNRHAADVPTNYKRGKHPAAYWKAQVVQLRSQIGILQRNIDNFSHSIHFAGGDYDNHAAYNDRQRQKLLQLDAMKSQLTDLQKRLEDAQEAARTEGYGNSVYDP